MSDLIQRLRGWRIDGTPADQTMREAADEIERLQGLIVKRGLSIEDCAVHYTAEDIRKAVLAEREACAKLLDDNWFRTQSECAAAIRARGGAE